MYIHACIVVVIVCIIIYTVICTVHISSQYSVIS